MDTTPTAAANDNNTSPLVGAMCEATRGENATKIAARIRATIKAQVKAGQLPAARYSVRTSYASLMAAIDVSVDDLPFCAWQLAAKPERDGERRVQATPDAARLCATLQAMLDLYNDRRSDKHPRYFGDAKIGDADERRGLYEYAQLECRGALDRAQPVVA